MRSSGVSWVLDDSDFEQIFEDVNGSSVNLMCWCWTIDSAIRATYDCGCYVFLAFVGDDDDDAYSFNFHLLLLGV